jgi:hypothetical protein
MSKLLFIFCAFFMGCIGDARVENDGGVTAAADGGLDGTAGAPDADTEPPDIVSILAPLGDGDGDRSPHEVPVGDGDGDGDGDPIVPGVCAMCFVDDDCAGDLICRRVGDTLGPQRCLPACDRAVHAREDSPACEAAFGTGEDYGTEPLGATIEKLAPPFMCLRAADGAEACAPIVDVDCIDKAYNFTGTRVNAACLEVDLCELWLAEQ